MIHWPDALDAARFLKTHWQKSPLVLRGAIPGFSSPLTPDELAGLACDIDVESRLVLSENDDRWRVLHGPFEEQVFADLPEQDWTLLNQDVDKHLPTTAELFSHFDFVPTWRLDDLMISFAVRGGTVGPHIDQYDVFLVQGLGSRTWQLDRSPQDVSLKPGLELAILENFCPGETVVLQPGDVLYLPPGVAHHGVGDQDSITVSVGFRAPSVSDLLRTAARLAAAGDGDERYGDPDLLVGESSDGSISHQAVERAAGLLRIGEIDMTACLGCCVTELKEWLRPEPLETAHIGADVRRRLARGENLVRHGMSRFASALAGDLVYLFVDGNCWRLPAHNVDAVRSICESTSITATSLGSPGSDDEVLVALTEVIGLGSLRWEDQADG